MYGMTFFAAMGPHLLMTVTLTIWYVSPRSTCQYCAPCRKVEAHVSACLLVLPSTARSEDWDPSVELCTVDFPALNSSGASALPATLQGHLYQLAVLCWKDGRHLTALAMQDNDGGMAVKHLPQPSQRHRFA